MLIQFYNYGGASVRFSKSQEKTLQQLLKEGAKSDYGIHYNMSSIRGVSDFEDKIPVGDYHSHKAFWGDFRGNYRSTWPVKLSCWEALLVPIKMVQNAFR